MRQAGLRRAGPVLLALLLLGACHSIDRDAFAHAPISVGALPFNEPIKYTAGANSGQVVPFQSGLFASYYAGAQYDRLDHQQVDANVNFIWDATGNPVISAPDGIDTNEGDFRLPDSWGIWSVVWEGYLLAPQDGTYLLRLHVNNGGWLQMKDASGNLVSIVACPGGTSFEGECDAAPTLVHGPNYIRISYYNNAPPSAVALFLWQPPGATSVDVVPTSSLATQATPARQRAFIYVHGTTGRVGGVDFPTLVDRLTLSYTRANFRYYEDRRFENPDKTCHADEQGNPGQRPFPLPLDQIQANYPFIIDNPEVAPGLCDSNDDIELNAVLLDADIAALGSRFDGVTVIANSGGGAIVRAYLSYATRAGTGTLNKLDAALMLEGVEHGTYLMAAYNGSALPNSDNPVVSSVRDFILQKVRDGVGHDPNRPAAQDFIPQTSLIAFYNQTALIPNQPHYVSVVGDVNVHVSAQVLFFTVPAGDLAIGDGVMLPGRDNPSELPLPPLGGARFLPSTVGRGASSTQWVLNRDYDVVVGSLAAPGQIASVVNDPAIHLNLSRMHEICVTAPSGTGTVIKRLDDALIDAFTALDVLPADPGRIGFGNRERVPCP